MLDILSGQGRSESSGVQGSVRLPTPSLFLDIVPISLTLCVAVCTAALVLSFRLNAPPYFKAWSLGGACLALSILLIVMRDSLPLLLSILLANLILIGAYVLFGWGARLMLGRRCGHYLVVGALGCLAFVAAYLADASLATRVIIISLSIGICATLLIADFVAIARSGEVMVAGWVMAMILLGLTASTGVTRTLASVFAPEGAPSLLALNGIVVACGVMASIGVAISLTWIGVKLFVASAAISGDAAPAQSSEQSLPDGWSLAYGRNALIVPGGAELKLTGKEYLVLQHLWANADAPVPRTTLNTLIGRGADNPKDRAIDILISRLRRKCSDAGADLPVTSVRGQGYIFHLRGEIAEAIPA